MLKVWSCEDVSGEVLVCLCSVLFRHMEASKTGFEVVQIRKLINYKVWEKLDKGLAELWDVGHSLKRVCLAPLVMVSGCGSSVPVPALPQRKQQLSAGASE